MSEQPIQPEIDLVVHRAGTGRPVVVLHGGGGPSSVAALVDHFTGGYDVLAPTLPGWDGAPRPDWLCTIDDLALLLLDRLRSLDLEDVTVVGSSVGGWIAAAMAVFDGDARRVSRVAIVDGTGVAIPGQVITDVFTLDAYGLVAHSFHDPDRFYQDPSTLDATRQAVGAANMASLRIFAGNPYMNDPALLHRLGRVRVPVLGVWGDSDRVVTPAYGAAYTAAFPNSRFEIVDEAGHLPHIEQPERTFALLDPFLAGD